MVTIDARNHILVPEHILLSKDEGKQVLKEMGLQQSQLPRILVTDAMVKLLNAQVGDMIKIIRHSPTAGVEISYRVVVEG